MSEKVLHLSVFIVQYFINGYLALEQSSSGCARQAADWQVRPRQLQNPAAQSGISGIVGGCNLWNERALNGGAFEDVGNLPVITYQAEVAKIRLRMREDVQIQFELLYSSLCDVNRFAKFPRSNIERRAFLPAEGRPLMYFRPEKKTGCEHNGIHPARQMFTGPFHFVALLLCLL